jgi:long-chain acyl-CoA synthetase
VTAIGLWNIAGVQPDLTAVVEPDGRTVTYGELTGRADRYARGLRALGLATGDSVVVMLPNGADLVALYFAAFETGLYIVPVNWHLVGAEIGYILGDCGAGAFVAHERFAAAAVDAADGAGVPASRRFAVGDVPGFRPVADLDDGGTGRPSDRTQGAPMVYTSGTSGRPKGVRRADRRRPRRGSAGHDVVLRPVRVGPVR